MRGNRHTEPQRGVSERNRRKAAALSAEMGSLSRSITRRSDQNCKIILQILILQFYRQLVKKFQKDFFDKLNALLFQRRAGRRLFSRIQHGFHKIARTGFGLHIGFPHIFANHARGSKLQAADRPDRRRW